MKKKKGLDHRLWIVDRGWFFVVFVALVCAIGIYLYRLPRREYTPRNDDRDVVVSRVVDGDTLEATALRQGYGTVKIRLIGIDAPEKEYKEQKEECYAEEAKEKLKELMETPLRQGYAGQVSIRLEKDVSERDKYDRLLRYVYVGEENINEVMVREGFARLATYPPDTKYYGKLKEAERVAKENKAGLWNYCMDSGSSPE